MNPVVLAILIGIAVAIIVSLVVYAIVIRPMYLLAQRHQADAEASERRLRQEADIKAEHILLEAKEESLNIRSRAEEEAKERAVSLTKLENRLILKEESLEDRRAKLTEREDSLRVEAKALAESESDLELRRREIEAELQRVSSLDKAEAREIYLKSVEREFREVAVRRAKEAENLAVQEIERKAKKTILDVIQRNVVDYVTEATLAVVDLPGEDMKGRIIGRDGRNIRAFEQVAGVDLIVDETPEAVLISSFDPVRRETARLALMNLMLDGRIHPGRIEELHEKAHSEVERIITEAGERAADRANVHSLSPRIIETMGRLRFRTSYAQNVLDHSVEVSRLASGIAAELGLNVEIAKRAGFLHDIGKALGPEWEGPHAITGMEFLRLLDEREPILHAVGAHHHEIEPVTPEAILVIIADTISAARPGARRENLENYIQRLATLESLANSFPGVERSYAVQAGREIRLIVKPQEVDDLGAAKLANEVARRIELELQYPGQIKVTVIRETRSQQIAK